MSVTPVRRRIADVVVGAEELVVRARRLGRTVLLIRVIVTVLEVIATVHLGDTFRPVAAGYLAIFAHE